MGRYFLDFYEHLILLYTVDDTVLDAAEKAWMRDPSASDTRFDRNAVRLDGAPGTRSKAACELTSS